MRHILRPAAENLEHALEAVHLRLVAAHFLRRDDLVERRAELRDIVRDLVLHRIREDHERDLLRDFRQPRRHIRVRAPGGHLMIDLQRIFGSELHAMLAAGALQRIVHHLRIGLPGPEHLIQAIGRENS